MKIEKQAAKKYLQIAANWIPGALIIFMSMFSLDSRSIVEFLMQNVPSFLIALAWLVSKKNAWTGVFCFVIVGAFFSVFFNGWAGLYFGGVCLLECLILVLLQKAQN